MINIYTKYNNAFFVKQMGELGDIDASSIVWIDLLNPSNDELIKISDKFSVEFPTHQERESIETSSRYWEDSDSISINAMFFVSFFFADKEKESCNESVAFILKDNILFTLRYRELKSFSEMHKSLLKTN
ncbi:MAG: magnesium and cobalt transport protein CorA, partial [Campylobacteraceae bacterium]|nr:magnesium and cobalt transport protein CorA [Campylobacteraceae bacterium]